MNNLIKDKITIIIPNRDTKHLDLIVNNFKETYKDVIYQIIVINQEDNEPFKMGQLYNIAFKYIRTEYILLAHNNIYNFNKINLIETYKKIDHPYIGFSDITQLIIKYNNEIKEIDTVPSDSLGGFIFLKYIDFCNSGGFSNLCFNFGYEYEIIDYKLNTLQRLNNNLGHIGYFKRNMNKTKVNEKIFNMYKEKKIAFNEDGYKQTSYNIIYDYYTKDNIRYIGVNNINVKEGYIYSDLYDKQLNNINKEIDIHKKKDIGVSICITGYKSKDTIKETLDSVIGQTWFQKYNNWEILVGIDSCRDTLKYVSTIMNNYKNLRVFMMDSNRGTYVTTNTLMSIAKYEHLIRFDSDDIMCPNMVETLLENADKYDIQRFRFAYLRNKWKTTKNSFGQHYIKKSIFKKFGGYRDWKCAADYDLILRTSKFVRLANLKDKYLFYYRTHDDSLTHSEETGMKSEYRQKLHDFIYSQDYTIEKNAIIECVTNTYKEIFSNIYEYYPDNYMYMISIKNEYPNII